MAQANADLVREAFLAINRGDDESFLQLLDEHVVWRSAAAGIVPATSLSGRDAVRHGRRETESGGRHVHTTLQELRTEGAHVLVFGVVTTETAHRGRMMLPMSWIWTVRDGQVVEVQSFTSRHAALAAWAARTG